AGRHRRIGGPEVHARSDGERRRGRLFVVSGGHVGRWLRLQWPSPCRDRAEEIEPERIVAGIGDLQHPLPGSTGRERQVDRGGTDIGAWWSACLERENVVTAGEGADDGRSSGQCEPGAEEAVVASFRRGQVATPDPALAAA